MDLSVRFGNKGAIDTVEDLHVSKNDKSANEQVQTEAILIVFFDVKGVFIIKLIPNIILYISPY